jgi:hypothetical protein
MLTIIVILSVILLSVIFILSVHFYCDLINVIVLSVNLMNIDM